MCLVGLQFPTVLVLELVSVIELELLQVVVEVAVRVVLHGSRSIPKQNILWTGQSRS
jgi:hypothetical protein